MSKERIQKEFIDHYHSMRAELRAAQVALTKAWAALGENEAVFLEARDIPLGHIADLCQYSRRAEQHAAVAEELQKLLKPEGAF